ncbi:hypothetical protein H312_01866 [Anncaliia algerae PRA339]|uniref:Uncharacterized protein n=1 Tax=Anncaliia algerae PRA339 TaxID=1288291 RepID=A0A059F133_9MICR|nr:hypothetical protein H312_01866 [Anncaliia algerae PRA339]
MDFQGYDDLKKVLADKDQIKALNKFSDLLYDTVNKILALELQDDPNFVLESIRNQKNVLERAEWLSDALKGDDLDYDNIGIQVDEFVLHLKKLEEFYKNNTQIN